MSEASETFENLINEYNFQMWWVQSIDSIIRDLNREKKDWNERIRLVQEKLMKVCNHDWECLGSGYAGERTEWKCKLCKNYK